MASSAATITLPRFLNFTAYPYYNRSQENSGSQSITDSSGVNLNSSIFGGSHFPGSVSFGENLNSTGNYGLPGIQGFTTHGNSTSSEWDGPPCFTNLPPVNGAVHADKARQRRSSAPTSRTNRSPIA